MSKATLKSYINSSESQKTTVKRWVISKSAEGKIVNEVAVLKENKKNR